MTRSTSTRFAYLSLVVLVPVVQATACSAPDRRFGSEAGGTDASSGGTQTSGGSGVTGGRGGGVGTGGVVSAAGSSAKGGDTSSAGMAPTGGSGEQAGDGAGGELVGGSAGAGGDFTTGGVPQGGTVSNGGASSGGKMGATGGTNTGGTVTGTGGASTGGTNTGGTSTGTGGANGGATSTGGTTTGTGGTGVVNCGALTNPVNGTVSAPATTSGSVATYGCATGYTLTGTATRTCSSTGTWSGTAPTCTVVNCGALTNPANGTVTAPATTYGATANYACSTGYTLTGSATRSCQASGAWSGTAPTCPIVNCGALTNPTNGSVSTPSTTYGATATYACSPGYGLIGQNARVCRESGWAGTAPTCQFCLFKGLPDTLAFWPLDDGAGQVIRDLGPNNLKGTLGSSTVVETADPSWLSVGRFGPALQMAGTRQQYAYVPAGVGFPGNKLTVEAWIRPNAGYAQFFTAGFINLFVAVDAPSRVEWGIGDGNNWSIHSPAAQIPVGVWHYIAVTYDGATMTAYVDGAAIGSMSATRIVGIPGEYYLGGRPSNTFLDGVLGPVRVSSTAHAATEIAAAWNDANACPPPP